MAVSETVTPPFVTSPLDVNVLKNSIPVSFVSQTSICSGSVHLLTENVTLRADPRTQATPVQFPRGLHPGVEDAPVTML